MSKVLKEIDDFLAIKSAKDAKEIADFKELSELIATKKQLSSKRKVEPEEEVETKENSDEDDFEVPHSGFKKRESKTQAPISRSSKGDITLGKSFQGESGITKPKIKFAAKLLNPNVYKPKKPKVGK